MGLWQRILVHSKSLLTPNGLSAGAALGLALLYFIKSRSVKRIPEVKLSYFLLALKQNLISEIIFDGLQLVFRGYNNETWYQTNAQILKRDRIFKMLRDKPEVQFQCVESKKMDPNQVLSILLIGSSLAYVAGILVARSLQFGSPFLTSKAQTKSTGVKFDSIYGLDHAKKQLRQIIDYLSEPGKFQQVGARLRRGVLIYGPPGTGKTMLAKATATESKVKFIYCSATEFMEVYVGLGAKRVRELFQRARSQSPAIIFIDEIDSIAYKRKSSNLSGMESGGDNERVNTLNQLLTEIDGFNANDNVVVIAATNRIQTIDEAFMRSGRFDIKIQVKLPNQIDRLGILRVHLIGKKQVCSEEGLQHVSQITEACSGADMENISNESAYIAIEDHRDTITDQDLMVACKKLLDEKLNSGPLQQQ